MVNPLSLFLCISLLSWSSGAFSDCADREPGYGSRKVDGLISINAVPRELRPEYFTFEIEIPVNVDGLELVDYVILVKGCTGERGEHISVPLRTYLINDVRKAEIEMRSADSSDWSLFVTYLPPKKEGMVLSDGPSIESWEKLEHNKTYK